MLKTIVSVLYLFCIVPIVSNLSFLCCEALWAFLFFVLCSEASQKFVFSVSVVQWSIARHYEHSSFVLCYKMLWAFFFFRLCCVVRQLQALFFIVCVLRNHEHYSSLCYEVLWASFQLPTFLPIINAPCFIIYLKILEK